MKRDGAQATQVLATEAAARLGVSRAEARAEDKAAAMQTQAETMRWVVIIGVIVLAAIVLLAVAD